MPEIPQYSYRDRVKFACYSYALEKGMDEAGMVELFIQATERIRGMEKSAFVNLDSLGNYLGLFGALGGAATFAHPVMGLTGHLGYAAGQGARHLTQGYVPSTDDLQLMDEAEEYKSAMEDIKRRIHLNRLKRQQSQVPSNRRIF